MTVTLHRDSPIFDLLNGKGTIPEAPLRKLFERGYTTAGSVALISSPLQIAKSLGISQDIMIHIVHTAQYRTAMVIQRRRPRFLEGDPIWFDIETDLRWKRIWLIGAVDSKENKFYNFYANDWYDESNMLKKFDEFLRYRPNRPLMYFSCNGFDVRISQNACARLGLVNHSIFTQPEQDICYELRKSYYLPTKNMKLKTMARFLGYDMSLEGRPDYMDGKECAEHYERHALFNDPIDPNVFVYNENDVWMLPFVVNRQSEVAITQDVGE
jgi:predicted RecB family nuclease